MISYINRIASQVKRTAITTKAPAEYKPTTEHFEPVLEEVRAFGTDFNDVLRPAFIKYNDAAHEPLIASEKRIMESAMKMQELCHELAVVAPDLIQAARGTHPLNIATIDTPDHMERDGPWNP